VRVAARHQVATVAPRAQVQVAAVADGAREDDGRERDAETVPGGDLADGDPHQDELVGGGDGPDGADGDLELARRVLRVELVDRDPLPFEGIGQVDGERLEREECPRAVARPVVGGPAVGREQRELELERGPHLDTAGRSCGGDPRQGAALADVERPELLVVLGHGRPGVAGGRRQRAHRVEHRQQAHVTARRVEVGRVAEGEVVVDARHGPDVGHPDPGPRDAGQAPERYELHPGHAPVVDHGHDHEADARVGESPGHLVAVVRVHGGQYPVRGPRRAASARSSFGRSGLRLRDDPGGREPRHGGHEPSGGRPVLLEALLAGHRRPHDVGAEVADRLGREAALAPVDEAARRPLVRTSSASRARICPPR
jgi:hypothetical protein